MSDAASGRIMAESTPLHKDMLRAAFYSNAHVGHWNQLILGILTRFSRRATAAKHRLSAAAHLFMVYVSATMPCCRNKKRFLAPSGNMHGLFRELNPGPLAPEARIMPLDQTANEAFEPFGSVCSSAHALRISIDG
mgnify:CR=1 FL=1